MLAGFIGLLLRARPIFGPPLCEHDRSAGCGGFGFSSPLQSSCYAHAPVPGDKQELQRHWFSNVVPASRHEIRFPSLPV